MTPPQATYLAALILWRESLTNGQRRPRPSMQPALRPALLRSGWVVEVESRPSGKEGGYIRQFDITPDGDAAFRASDYVETAMARARLGMIPSRNTPVLSAPADKFVPTARRGR